MINQGKVTGGGYGIYNVGVLMITEGEVSGSNGIENYEGTVTIGSNEKEINTYTPSINGTGNDLNHHDLGLYNENLGYAVFSRSTNGVFNFYNGQLIGKEEAYNEVPVLRTDTVTVKETQYGDSKKVTLKYYYNYSIEKNNTVTKYEKLVDAVAAANSGDTIKLCQNTSLDSAVTINKTVTLDLQNYQLSVENNSLTVDSGADLTITKGYLSTDDYLSQNQEGCVINNNGTLIISEIYIRAYSGENAKAFGIKNKGTLEMTQGSISATGDSGAIGIQNNGGSITITNGKVESNAKTASYGIYNQEEGKVTIGDSADDINVDTPKVIVSAECTDTNGTAYGIYNNNGTFNFYNGTIKGKIRYNVEPSLRDNTTVKVKVEEGYQIAYLELLKQELKNAQVTLEKEKYTYSGLEIKPTITVKKDNTTLKQDTDYEVSYSNNIDVGEATLTINGINNYLGKITKQFNIVQKDIEVQWSSNTELKYNGQEQILQATANSGVNREIIELSISTDREAKDPGTYTASASIKNVTGGQNKSSNYNLTNATKQFTIKEVDTSNGNSNTISDNSNTSNGNTNTDKENSNISNSNSNTANDNSNTLNSNTNTSNKNLNSETSTTIQTAGKVDSTTADANKADKALPKTGVTALKVFGIVILGVILIIAFKKYKSMKEVK